MFYYLYYAYSVLLYELYIIMNIYYMKYIIMNNKIK